MGSDWDTAGLVNPLVNTQFQYLDVGVIVDVTPRIHVEDNDREIGMKLSIEVSSVTEAPRASAESTSRSSAPERSNTTFA